jgi:hypothetical protein
METSCYDTSEYHISEIGNGILTLDDGSRWKMSLIGKTIVSRWTTMDSVVLGVGFLQQYKITHEIRKECIEVELIKR